MMVLTYSGWTFVVGQDVSVFTEATSGIWQRVVVVDESVFNFALEADRIVVDSGCIPLIRLIQLFQRTVGVERHRQLDLQQAKQLVLTIRYYKHRGLLDELNDKRAA